uniref:hypothetical protein n=1 Tax=uncultured Mucilaginibacter sp. TaxID=797541 RepID=UPI0025D1007F
LFSNLTPFEYDEEYVILKLEKPAKENSLFNIQDLIELYPLSEQAKNSIESKIDVRIKLSKPIFEDILEVIESNIQQQEILKAIDALWKICDFKEANTDYIERIGFGNIMRGLDFRRNGIKAKKIETGNYWNYVIAYDRIDYFPNTNLGYFFDAGQAFAYSKGLPGLEGTALQSLLDGVNSKNPLIKFKEAIEILETSEMAKGYIAQTGTDQIKSYIITPLYFMLKEELRKTDDLADSILIKRLPYLQKEFEESFKYAIVLLGAFFGFRKFYDAYYDSLNLRFYKNAIQPQDQSNVDGDENNRILVPKETKGSSLSERNVEYQTLEFDIPTRANEITIEIDKKSSGSIDGLPSLPLFDVEPSSNVLEKYKQIILDQLTLNGELTLTELGQILKKETNRKPANNAIEKIIDHLENVKIFEKGKKVKWAKFSK